MRWSAFRFVVVALALSACGDDGPCDSEQYGYFRWTMDGTQVGSRCFEPRVLAETARLSVGIRRPFLMIAVGGVEQGIPHPFCWAALDFYNVDLVDGARGETAQEDRDIGEGYDPSVFPLLAADVSGQGTCGAEMFDGVPPIAGTWEVSEGGTWESIVEIVARDLTFESFGGHELRLDEMRWRARVPSPFMHP